jgi:hypothetical protein
MATAAVAMMERLELKRWVRFEGRQAGGQQKRQREPSEWAIREACQAPAGL